jgi:hypothetical protein
MTFFKFVYLSAIDFGIQWVLWGLASWLKTEKFYDLAGILKINTLYVALVDYRLPSD